ncbi:MAG: hypothetical protein KGJ10_05025 [Acidobacteriota bacterium]|nr:hypothetical protein [Acidobacteriota bacterium]
MNSRSDEDFELELRSIPSVVAVSVERDELGAANVVTLHDAGTQLARTETLARQVLSFYYPQAKLIIEPIALSAQMNHRPPRVIIERADVTPGDAGAEVRLTCNGATGTGRAGSGPLIGGAQATLDALRDLGMEVPYSLMSASAVPLSNSWPVIVVLRSNVSRAELMGIAHAPDEIWSAARATLNALNRYLDSRITS